MRRPSRSLSSLHCRPVYCLSTPASAQQLTALSLAFHINLPSHALAFRCLSDAAKFGTMLLDSRHVGSVRRPSDPRNDHSIAPGSSSVVEAMDDQLLVGVFSDGRESETGYLMVVDLRGSTIPGAIAPRTVTLTIHPGCATAVVPGPAGGWFAESDTAPESAVSKGTQQVALTLQGGGGALLRITAGTGGCGQLLRSTRQWWYDPRTINLKHSYPETSLKSATYGGSTWMPQGFDSGEYTDGNVAGHDGNNEMTRDATGQGYGRGWCNERPCLPGRYRYFHKPGGLAGADSSFIIGGSQWESSSAAVWSSDAEAKAWADAAFLMVSFPAEASATALGNGIAWGTSHGIFTLLSTQLSGTVMDPDLLVQLATNYSCHTNFAGFVLGSNFSAAGTDVDAVVKAADTLRSEAYWQLPLVLGVDSVDTAAKLGDQGVPLPAVQLTFEHTGSALEWARRTVGMLAPLASPAGRNATMTPAVSIDPCGTDSDSMMRFAAYTSVLLGGQALWWEGMGRCAPVGSSTFETVSSINNRVAQWAEPLFMRKVDYVPKGSWLADDIDDDVDAGSKKNRGKVSNAKAGQSVPPFGNTSFFIDAVYSTSSIKLPPLPGANGSLVHAQPPGSTFAALIQAMDPELIVVNLRNATSFGKNHTSECKTAAGPQGQDCINYDSVLWIISTNLSTLRGGAPVQQLNISMHESVWTTHPIEPDKYQGFSTDCNLAWLGPNMPLRLPGGSVQVVSYSIGPLTSSAMTSRATRPKSQRVGRRAPSQWPGIKMDDTTSALAPSLTHPSDELRQPPASAALTWVQARRGQAADVYVDCDHGSDTHTGRSASSAVATLEKARSLVRKLRSTATFVATGATVVEVRGKCQLTKALQLTKNDSGTASSPIVWRGMDGAVIGAGRKLTNWTKVNWPGAPLGSVLRASVPKEDFPLIVTGTGPSASGWIKSLRVITPDASAALIEDQWVARARWPKPTPGNSQAAGFEGKNYSSGWLSSANWTKHESVGLDPAVVPPEIYADYWNLFVNNFGLDGERDVINDLSRVHAANLSALQPSLSVSLEEGTEKSQRFFLENVQSALAEGEFYVSFNESALYVWPKAAWKHPDGHVEMVAPLDVHVLNMSNADHVIISNLTFRDSGYEEAGCWCGPANEPSDSAISIWNSSFVTVEASTFLPGVSGWAVAATGGGQHLHIVGNRVHAVGQGGFLLYSGGLLGGASIKASKTLACNHSIVEWNVVERAGRILKHVAGVAFRAASWCTARHNRIVDMPRYAFDADTVWPELIGISNIFEYNIIDGASLETSDTGAMQFTGQGPMFDLPTPFDMNTTIQYNNISRVMGADAVDGRI